MPELSEKSIFLNALDHHSPVARDQYLYSVCGDDVTLRSSIDALLKAHRKSENPLDRPVPAVGDVGATMAAEKLDYVSDIGRIIGPYRVMEQIGEGGFGLVYVAQQESPVRRKVALKIIKPGTGTSEVLARFDAERQAVALMDHPNIAQIFDAGVTNDSRPYFVMELVRGMPITEFCDRHELDCRQRIELFQDVCAAIHHAHQKGVIHRDLKPSNMLVTLHDAKPVAKVIDFGVAKAIGQSLTDQTIYTRLYSMVGTPLYMSPEQASMSSLDVDTRSDIYSLGVMLYELLTGTTPFDRRRLDTVGYDEMRRIIREEEPPKPSVRLTTIDKRNLDTIGKQSDRQSDSRFAIDTAKAKHLDSIPSDLDWIVMKAMEKDRTRRYESAAAMAADLRRFLLQQPIEARPPTQAYRLSKFVRRNRVALFTGSLVLMALLAGTAVSLYQASRAIDERNQKDIALRDAIAATEQATEARLEVEEFSDRLKNANVLLGTARSFEDLQEYGDAIDAYNTAVDLVPNYYLVWVQRAQLLIKIGLWNQAASDFSAALQLDAPVDSLQWQGVSALFMMTDRASDHKKLCEILSQPIAENPNALTWNVIRSILAGTENIIEPQQLSVRAEALLMKPPPMRPGPSGQRMRRGPAPGPEDPWGPPRPRWQGGRDGFAGPPDHGPTGRGPGDRPPGPGSMPRERSLPPPVQQYIAGWAALRANRNEDALEHLQTASSDRRWPNAGLTYPLIAMAHHKAGNREMALAALRDSDEWMDQLVDQQEDSTETSRHWIDLVEGVVTHRQATLMITGRAPVIDAKIYAIQQKSNTLIRGDVAE